MRNLIIHPKNVIPFLFAIALFVGCQKDEVADANSQKKLKREEIISKNFSNAEAEKTVKEIVNLKDYQELGNQATSLADKINDIRFFDEGIINEKDEFDYNVVKERLSMTSFHSVDEFFQEVEAVMSLNKKIIDEHPELLNSSIRETIIGKKKNVQRNRNCDCDYVYNKCVDDARQIYLIELSLCSDLGGNYSAFCVAYVVSQFNKDKSICREYKEDCEDNCFWEPGDDMKTPTN